MSIPFIDRISYNDITHSYYWDNRKIPISVTKLISNSTPLILILFQVEWQITIITLKIQICQNCKKNFE